MDKFENELKVAITNFGKEKVNVVLDEEEGFMYGSFHSLNDSFPVTNDYQLVRFNGIELADKLDIGWSEI